MSTSAPSRTTSGCDAAFLINHTIIDIAGIRHKGIELPSPSTHFCPEPHIIRMQPLLAMLLDGGLSAITISVGQVHFCPEPHIIGMLNDHHIVEVAAGDCHSMALNVFGSVRPISLVTLF
jgi:hypothetical protein